MKTKLVNPNYEEDYVANLLRSRGIEDVGSYLHPTSNCLNNPKNLSNIAIGAALYLRVVKNGGTILLLVDSDTDGMCSSGIIYQYSKRINPECKIEFVLHEHKEHGLGDIIDDIVDSKTHYDLVLCPDASTNDIEYHNILDELHIPCLCIDHHPLDSAISDNAIIINNQTSPKYPNKELVGAGVTWQFCRYVDSIEGTNYADDYIDLAAVGQIGDMGSLLPIENRYIVYEGLKESNIKNSFLKSILKKQAYVITGKENATWQEITSATNATVIAFYITPLINALIRMGTMEEKKRLFLGIVDGSRLVPSGKRGEKGQLVRADVESVRECINAKSRQKKTQKLAVERMEYKIFKYDLLENKVLLITLDEEDNFPSELNGLIANQLCSKYKRPTIVGREDSFGMVKGSARAPGETELTDFKQFLLDSHLFSLAQGHARALGAHIPAENIDRFLKYSNEKLANVDFGENCYDINFARFSSEEDISNLIFDIGNHKDLWGQGMAEPLIAIDAIPIEDYNVQVMGANQDTLKITYNGVSYLKFHAEELIEDIASSNNRQLNIVGRANINEWCGEKTAQIFIDSYEIF